jgi:hypothetical protein
VTGEAEILLRCGPVPYWVDRQPVNNKEINAEYNKKIDWWTKYKAEGQMCFEDDTRESD